GKYADYGALGVVEKIGRFSGGERGAVVRATARMRIGAGTTGPGAALWVEATPVDEPTPTSGRLEELVREYRALVTTLLQQRGAWQTIDSLQQVSDPSTLADLAGYAPYLSQEQKTWLLQTPSAQARLERLIAWTRDHLAELDVAERITQDVKEGMERQQREFLLRQQLAAIRKELAELSGAPDSEEEDYRAKVTAANLPPAVHKAAMAEVDKLERTSEQSPEVGWIRTWLDTVLGLPWNTRTEDSYDIVGAREVLDADHAGLEDVKDRIIEYLAVRKRRAEREAALAAAGSGSAGDGEAVDAAVDTPAAAGPATARRRDGAV